MGVWGAGGERAVRRGHDRMKHRVVRERSVSASHDDPSRRSAPTAMLNTGTVRVEYRKSTFQSRFHARWSKARGFIGITDHPAAEPETWTRHAVLPKGS